MEQHGGFRGRESYTPPLQARKIRETIPERIASSRMVRRWEPQEGTFAEPTAKCRWCAHGRQGPDTGSSTVFSPTPQTTSMMALMQVMMNFNMLGYIAVRPYAT
eukprot:167673-Pyramimonas_sp.AAC.1